MTKVIPRAFLYGVLIAIAVFYAAPLYIMVVTSLKSEMVIRSGAIFSLPQGLDFGAWKRAWGEICIGVSCEGLKPYFLNSVYFVVPAVLLSTLVGAINGYVFSFWRFRGSELIFSLFLLGSFIPLQIVILPMARLLGSLELVQSVAGLILTHIVYGIAFTTLFFRNFYVTIPQDIHRAAMIDGAGIWHFFWKVLLPISWPTIMVTLIWQFTAIWNDFLFGAVFTTGDTQPLTVALNNMVNTSTGVKDYGADMAGALIVGLPPLLIYFFAGKYFLKGMLGGAVKS